MPIKPHPVVSLVMDAMAADSVVSRDQIQQLREQSTRGITRLKVVFWIALAIFNLMIWFPFPSSAYDSLRLIVGLGAALVAIFFPIMGIRRHRGYLTQLEDCKQAPKRKMTNDAGRQYMDRVKKQGRFFVHAEYAALESKTSS